MEATIGFKPGVWQKEINVSDFIKNIVILTRLELAFYSKNSVLPLNYKIKKKPCFPT